MTSVLNPPWLWVVRPQDEQSQRWHETLTHILPSDAVTWVYSRMLHPVDFTLLHPPEGFFREGIHLRWLFLASPNVALYTAQALKKWLKQYTPEKLQPPTRYPFQVACIGKSTAQQWQACYAKEPSFSTWISPEAWYPEPTARLSQGGWLQAWAKAQRDAYASLGAATSSIMLWLPRGDLARPETLQTLQDLAQSHGYLPPVTTMLYTSTPTPLPTLLANHQKAWCIMEPSLPWRVVWLTSPESAKAWYQFEQAMDASWATTNVRHAAIPQTYYLCMGHTTYQTWRSLGGGAKSCHSHVLCPEVSGLSISETLAWLLQRLQAYYPL
ncbi:MAG: hypothetical protein ACKO37_01965 [Vampirovibrionales bacterium]